ncbi:MAG: L-seryl-tRNA(Sec) selenium transferase [Planctomycetota bacterium]|nr:MAG: L-seryl-tRNA(Sec) selenium transferase [Planctomycetota bacterium]
MKESILRQLPKMDTLLEHPQLQGKIPRKWIQVLGNQVLDQIRNAILEDRYSKKGDEIETDIVERILREWQDWNYPYFQRIINGTGVILHTGLGRAPLAEEVREALKQNSGYCMVEIEQETGERGVREKKISRLLQILTGAEAATVVNNNAGATLICLAALAKDKEVILSRGQMVEIGGSFRIPEVMKQSGALLREVGCTNKTHLNDYEEAIHENTGLILEVHTSNYRIQGFFQSVPTRELVRLAEKHNLPFMYDMGSGNLADLRPLGIHDEPTVQEKVEEGAHILTFSGDKLLGAAQAGIIVGKREYVAKIRRHPLFRALRPGKLDLMALEQTLLLYLKKQHWERIPSLFLIKRNVEELKIRANNILKEYQRKGQGRMQITVEQDTSQIGSGALPTHFLPSFSITLQIPTMGAEKLARILRKASPPVFARIQHEKVWINLRTLFPDEDQELLRILLEIEDKIPFLSQNTKKDTKNSQ